MEPKLGNYVKTKAHNTYGRVYAIYHNFVDTNYPPEWFHGLKPAKDKSTLSEKWYSILVDGVGSIMTNHSDIKECYKAPLWPFKNSWEKDYFDDEEEAEVSKPKKFRSIRDVDAFIGNSKIKITKGTVMNEVDWCHAIGRMSNNISMDSNDRQFWEPASLPAIRNSYEPADLRRGIIHKCLCVNPDLDESIDQVFKVAFIGQVGDNLLFIPEDCYRIPNHVWGWLMDQDPADLINGVNQEEYPELFEAMVVWEADSNTDTSYYTSPHGYVYHIIK